MRKENSKKYFEDSKPGTIGARIAVLLSQTDKSLAKVEDDYGVGNGTFKSWKDESVEKSTNTIKNFLNQNKINLHWWKTGEGKIFMENGTYEHNEPAIPENLLGDLEVYRTIVEGKTEYLLIPRSVLQEKYRIQSIEDMEKDRAVLDALIEFNRELLRRTDTSTASVKPPKVQKG
jgi:hypothetical protein